MKASKPLEDIRILTIESYGAGPWATLQLADLGAEVIKIEQPGIGDISRAVPPGAKEGDSLFFQCLNRGKKSITLDLRLQEGRDVFYRLLPSMDVLFANPKGSMPEKMGITYEHLKEYNPKLVCCFLTGWGRVGPRRDYPGYDYLVQALSGIAWMGGEPDGPPARCGISIIDMAAGTNAAMLILAALHKARTTGQGCDADTSLFEVALSYLNYIATWHLSTGFEPKRLPLGAHQTIVPSQMFATADSWIMIMAQQDKFYQALVTEIGRPELAEDPRFRTMEDRYKNRDVLIEILAEIFRSRTTDEWVVLLGSKVPAAPINSIPQALRDPQVDALDMIISYDHPSLGRIKQIRPPFRLTRYKPDYEPCSAMGADTETVLAEYAGITKDEIDLLHTKGVI
ncbi:MAG: CoA transferase [Deltaproteobacteria bacterium]|nr:CoA transferase [Deltaproteobacteria bacterium]